MGPVGGSDSPFPAPADSVNAMARPNFGDFFANWRRSDLSVGDKMRQAVKNNSIKFRAGSPCCGNHGEVGC